MIGPIPKHRKRTEGTDLLSGFVRSEKEAAIAVIMALAYRIGEKTHHQVFVNYSPHVQKLDIEIIRGGWIDGGHNIRHGMEVYIGRADYQSGLVDIIHALEDLLSGAFPDVPGESRLLTAVKSA